MRHRKLYSYKFDFFFFFFYSPLPDSKTLVVWRTDKSAVFINKSDGVDGSQVAIVLLDHLTCPDVPLLDRQRHRVKQRGVKSTFKMWLNCGDVATLISYRASVWAQCAHSIKREDNRIFVASRNKQIGHTLVLTVLHSSSFCFFVFLF